MTDEIPEGVLNAAVGSPRSLAGDAWTPALMGVVLSVYAATTCLTSGCRVPWVAISGSQRWPETTTA